ncbi:MAG: PIG-L family deacetylase [Ornithinimicrobium sp.]
MPSARRALGRLVNSLPERQGTQVHRSVQAATRRLPGRSREPVSYVISPHPDDETLRLAGLVTALRHNRAGRLILVAIGDGGGSAQARRMGWSPDYEREYRRAEQAAAWSALTGGTGEIIRLGLWDRTHTPEVVRDALAPLVTKRAQFYVAAHEDDYHPDHLAVVEGARLLNAEFVRFSLAPLMEGEGKIYTPKPDSIDAVMIAVGAYEGFGQLSVRKEFRALREAGYRSRVTE